MLSRPRLSRRRVLRAVAWAAAAVVVAYFADVFAGPNTHVVVAGGIYRCSQPSAGGLARLIDRHGVRTVLNLRGTAQAMHQPKSKWYRDEAETTFAEDVSQEDITLSAYLLPPPAEVRRALEVLDRADRPILIHCKQGADRTGLVSAVAVLTQTDGSLAAARRELWPVYGHFPLGRTTAMDDFLDRYESWLAGRGHAPRLFREWLADHYTPGPAASEYEWRDPPAGPVPADAPFALKLRATNRSAEPWRFEPGDHAALHLLARVSAAGGGEATRTTAGLFRRTVAPGEAVDFTLAFGPLPAGAYTVTAEMIDARGCGVPIRSNSFVKLGDGCAITTIEVR